MIWLVIKLLTAYRRLEHQPVRWESEHGHTRAVLGVFGRTVRRGDRAHLGAQFEFTFLEVCQRLGGLEEDHFVEILPSSLCPDVDLCHGGFANTVAVLKEQAFPVLAPDDNARFVHAWEDHVASGVVEKVR